jgi:hypothetical protein
VGGEGEGEMNDDRKLMKPEQMHTIATSSTKKPEGRLSRDVQSKIGQQLRGLYEDVVKQGVPDRFAELLIRMEKPDNKGSQE